MQTMSATKTEQAELLFFRENKVAPNSHLPALFYKKAFEENNESLEDQMYSIFNNNKWNGTRKGRIRTGRYYHTASHEVIGITKQAIFIELGGFNGSRHILEKGDVLILPAGVSIRLIKGAGHDVRRGFSAEPTENMQYAKASYREKAKEAIACIPIPKTDPIYGRSGGLVDIWNNIFLKI